MNDWGPGLTLEATDGKLEVRGALAPPTEAKFLPNGDFYLYAPHFAFSPRPGGDLAETQGVGAVSVLHRRAARVQPAAEDLASIAGVYRCDEIDSTYRLTPDESGGGLVLSCLRFAPLKLAAADADAFDGAGLRLAVLRDSAGAPSGFTLATGRVRGLAFRRIDGAPQ